MTESCRQYFEEHTHTQLQSFRTILADHNGNPLKLAAIKNVTKMVDYTQRGKERDKETHDLTQQPLHAASG